MGSMSFVGYQGGEPGLPVTFEYPTGWVLEASSGSHEAYTQVQVYAPDAMDPRMRNYLVVRVVPSSASGGRYPTLEEMMAEFRQTLLSSLHVEREEPIDVLGAHGQYVRMTGSLRLPWKAARAQDVPVTGARIFIERESQFFEIGWLATPEAAHEVESAFQHLVESLKLAPRPAD